MSGGGRADDLCFLGARTLARLIRSGQVSAREVMAAHLDRIERFNGALNAIVSRLDPADCLRLAEDADRRLASGAAVGPLHGLPTAFKDLQPAAGLRWTQGSPIFADTVATADSVLVERLRAAGAIAIGKTNVPEFGMGSHTYNAVFGTTRNPYDLSKSAGGSSGGAAAALAAGLLPIADGSDLGGSLRNPASFNNIVALRPTVGLVPTAPNPLPLLGFGVNGPMARSVEDAAWLLSVMAGPDPRDPACLPSTPSLFAEPLERDFTGTRVAWWPDLGGLPLDAAVRETLAPHRATLEAIGCIVDDAGPDLRDADDIFLTLRAFRSAAVLGPLLETARDRIKPEAVGEIEEGLALHSRDVARAMLQHAQLLERVAVFETRYAFTVCAVSQVVPFDAAIAWPREVAGVTLRRYTDWMKSCYRVSTTFRPAVSVPAGFTPGGLPVGIQIVGRHRDDRGVLQLARAFEWAAGCGAARPPIADRSAGA